MRPFAAAIATLCVAVVSLGSGCAYTKLETRCAPGYEQAQYEKVMVWVDIADGILRLDAERRFVRELTGKGAQAVTYDDLFFPEKQYTPEEFNLTLQANSVDATLHVVATSTATEGTYIPGSSYTSGSVNPVTGSYDSSTSFFGGFTVETPTGYFTARLYDAQTGDVAWVGYAETDGDLGSDYKTLLRSLADKASGDLIDGGVLKATPKR